MRVRVGLSEFAAFAAFAAIAEGEYVCNARNASEFLKNLQLQNPQHIPTKCLQTRRQGRIKMPTMSKAKRPSEPAADPPPFHVGYLLSGRIDTDRLADGLNRYYASMRPRPSKTSIVLTAVEDFLTKKGFLPRPEGEP